MVVHDPADTDRLSAGLSKHGATAAMAHHSDHPQAYNEDLGEVPDHDMTIGVWQGFGYLSFADLDHDLAYPDGVPDSPGFAADYAEYPTGSGVTLQDLRAALVEFLETAQRPTRVDWREPT
jgi:hypothetical protein